MSARVWPSLLVAFCLVGCGVEVASSGTATLAQKIVGGVSDSWPNDPAVAALAVFDGAQLLQFCTAVLVFPRTLLTAAHCVNEYGPNATYQAVFGADLSHPTAIVDVSTQLPNPGYQGQSPIDDVAVMRLRHHPDGIFPVALNEAALEGAVGQTVRHVGFGVTSAFGTDNGQKREVSYPIRQVAATTFESGATGEQTCTGDSGGPGFWAPGAGAAEVVAGIVSTGDPSCAQTGTDMWVDAYAAWIRDSAAWENDPCGEDGICSQELCSPPDPDCVPEGQPCVTDEECPERLCAHDPQRAAYCSRPCSVPGDCASDQSCVFGVCLFEQRPSAEPGQPCQATTFCVDGGICDGPNAENLRCVAPCTTDQECAASSTSCVVGALGGRYCGVASAADGGITMTRGIDPSRTLGKVAQGCSEAGGTPLGLLALSSLWAVARRRRWLVSALAVTAVSACGPVTPEEVAQQQQAIVGGTVDVGDPEVFMLTIIGNNGQGAGCTATHIAPRTLITAAHCADPTLIGATSVQIYANNDTYADQAPQQSWIPVTDVRIHPNWNSQTLTGDLAMLQLQYAPDAPNKPWNRSDVSGLGGQPIRVLGYGITSNSAPNSAGTKREVDLVIDQVDSTHIYMGDNAGATSGHGICHGDSGGPTFYNFSEGEKLIGVHSFDANGQCTLGADTRTDAYQTFIQQWLTDKEAPTCDRDGQCVNSGCASPDPDCVCIADGQCNPQCPNLLDDPDCPRDCVANGVCATENCPVPDPDCTPEGGQCTNDDQCQQRHCVGDTMHPVYYCARSCTTSSECPQGEDCDTSIGACRFDITDQANPGEPCTIAKTYCTGGAVCAGPNTGDTFCEPPCIDQNDCAQGIACVSGRNNIKYCNVPQPTVLPLARAEAPPAGGCSSSGVGAFALALAAWLGARRRSTR